MGWRGITWSGEEERDVPTTNPSLPQDFSFVDFGMHAASIARWAMNRLLEYTTLRGRAT